MAADPRETAKKLIAFAMDDRGKEEKERIAMAVAAFRIIADHKLLDLPPAGFVLDEHGDTVRWAPILEEGTFVYASRTIDPDTGHVVYGKAREPTRGRARSPETVPQHKPTQPEVKAVPVETEGKVFAFACPLVVLEEREDSIYFASSFGNWKGWIPKNVITTPRGAEGVEVSYRYALRAGLIESVKGTVKNRV